VWSQPIAGRDHLASRFGIEGFVGVANGWTSEPDEEAEGAEQHNDDGCPAHVGRL
jgi:hypothetical protein